MSPPDAATTPNERVTSLTGCSDVTMTSLSNSVLWMHQRKMAARYRGLLPPSTSTPALFPFPVYSLSPASALYQRRAWNVASLQKTSKELLNTAAATTMSLMGRPFVTRLPWQPPLCCLLQPEIARQCRAGVRFPAVVGDTRPSQPQRRRDSPVNWLLSDDDEKVTSSRKGNRKWNSPADRRLAFEKRGKT